MHSWNCVSSRPFVAQGLIPVNFSFGRPLERTGLRDDDRAKAAKRYRRMDPGRRGHSFVCLFRGGQPFSNDGCTILLQDAG